MEKNDISCDCEVIHEDLVKQTKEKMPLGEELYDLADFYKLFGDSTRIQILYGLDKNEMCVCDIASLLNMSISAVSHQLRVLREANLVRSRRAGKEIYYSLSDDHVRLIIECGLEHINELRGKE